MLMWITVVRHCAFDDVSVFLAQRAKLQQKQELERLFVTQMSAHICRRLKSRHSVGDAQLGPITPRLLSRWRAALTVALTSFWFVLTLAPSYPCWNCNVLHPASTRESLYCSSSLLTIAKLNLIAHNLQCFFHSHKIHFCDALHFDFSVLGLVCSSLSVPGNDGMPVFCHW